MAMYNPHPSIVKNYPTTEVALKYADNEKKERHQHCANEEHRPPPPLVNIQNRGDCECDVEYILHGISNEVASTGGKASPLEYVYSVVPSKVSELATTEHRHGHTS